MRRIVVAVLVVAAFVGAALGVAIAALLRPDHDAARAPAAAAALRAGAAPPNVFFRGTPNCYVPPGQGHVGICAPPPLVQGRLGTGVFGADVSNYQGCVDPAGLRFVYVKAWEWGYPDRYAACTIGGARARHVPWGTYCFARDSHPAKASADACARSAHGGGPLGAADDFETNDGGLSAQGQCSWLRSFNAELRARLREAANPTYDAPGLWPGCASVPHSVEWRASLGSCARGLSGFSRGLPIICQYTFNGPHGGDGDVLLRGTTTSLAAAVAGRSLRPVSAHANALCREYEHYRREVAARHFPERNRPRAKRVRGTLARHHYGCKSSGKAYRK